MKAIQVAKPGGGLDLVKRDIPEMSGKARFRVMLTME